MANTLKCPKCASPVDVTSFAPGSTVRCSDCGGMMRVPSGRTGVRPAVKDPVGGTGTRSGIPAAGKGETKARTRVVGPGEMRETATRMRQQAVARGTQVRPKKSSTGLYVMLGIAALALIIGGVLFFLQTPPPAAPPEAPPAAKAPPPPKAPVAPKPPDPKPPVDPAPPPPPAPAPVPSGDAARNNWEETLKQLRGGGGFDVEGRPEQVYYQRVQKMGKSAFPYLVKYIDNEDPALGRAAVALLNALTSQNKPLPNETTRAKLKAEWEAWVKANP